MREEEKLERGRTSFQHSQQIRSIENLDENKFSIYFKILLNYFQVTAILSSIEFKWPFFISDTLVAYSGINGLESKIIAIDCIVNYYSINLQPIYLRVIIIMGVFGLLCVGSFFYLFLRSHKSKIENMNAIIMSLIVICIVLQSPASKILFDNINCREFGGKQYLIKQMDISCSTETHQKWVNNFSF